MAENEQLNKMRIEIFQDVNNNSKDRLFITLLDDAQTIALNTLYPYDDTKQELPNERRLKNWQTRCAIALYRAIGRIGIQAYSENNLNVTFLTSLLDDKFMNELIPKAGVPR